jgi:mannosyl-3-phosphoglycerate phosphatase
MLKENTIIFTDLDGTLLDHDSYSFKEASFMLDYLKTHDIPLIIVTSKTKNEVIRLQKLLDISTPFIIENGAGICVSRFQDYEMIPLGKDYSQIRNAFKRYARQIEMRGFFDMSIEEICEFTGLSAEQAAYAKERDFTEPFILQDEGALTALQDMARKDGLDVVKGGRFYHLITKGQDKASAIKRVVQYYQKAKSCRYKTVGLGDSENDLSMLHSVDTPILIPHPDGSYLACSVPNLIKAQFPGSKGWNSALKECFDVQ